MVDIDNKNKVRESDLKITLNGTNLLVERFEMPKETDSGLFLPDSYRNSKEDVNGVQRLDPYQKRGKILKIGISCSEEFRKHFREGDVIHFGFGGVEPIPLRKDVYTDDSPYALVNEYAIHWKEEGGE